MNIKFTKKDTLIIKGIAIILMIMHHLFAFPTRVIYEYSHYKLEFYIGEFGKICVSMFLFLSGLGIYYSLGDSFKYNIKKVFNKVKSIYFNYILIFLLFIPIGFFAFKVKFNLKEFILNFFGVISTYNNEWWFFRVYLILLITAPIFIMRISSKKSIAFLQIFFLYFIAKSMRIVFISINFEESYFINEIINVVLMAQSFYMGVLFAKFKAFEKLEELFLKYKLNNIYIHMLILISIVMIRKFIGGSTLRDTIIVPFFIFSSLKIVKNTRFEKLLTILGKHSNNIWLVHTFYCYYYFQNIIFLPCNWMLIFISLTIISLITSYLINKIAYEIICISRSQKISAIRN